MSDCKLARNAAPVENPDNDLKLIAKSGHLWGMTTLTKAFIIGRLIHDLKFLLGYLVTPVGIELVRHQIRPGNKNSRLISAIPGSMQQSQGE